jgi:hypothetical protein
MGSQICNFGLEQKLRNGISASSPKHRIMGGGEGGKTRCGERKGRQQGRGDGDSEEIGMIPIIIIITVPNRIIRAQQASSTHP